MGLSLAAVLAFTFAMFCFEAALDLRQKAVLRSPEEPEKLYSVVGQIDASNKAKKSEVRAPPAAHSAKTPPLRTH